MERRLAYINSGALWLHGVLCLSGNCQKIVFCQYAGRRTILCLSKTTIYVRGWDLYFFVIFSRHARFCHAACHSVLDRRSRAAVELENLALRHQIGVLRRSAKRPKSTPVDPLFCEPVLFEFIGAGGAAKGL